MPTFNQLVRKGRQTLQKKSTAPALQKGYITKIRRMSEPSIKLDDKKIDRIYTFVTCSYERDDNRTYVHAVEE